MADEGGQCHCGQGKFVQVEFQRKPLRQGQRDCALCGVAQQSEHRSLFSPCPKHIGCAWITGPVSVRIGQPVTPAYYDSERHRTDKISNRYEQDLGHKDIPGLPPWMMFGMQLLKSFACDMRVDLCC